MTPAKHYQAERTTRPKASESPSPWRMAIVGVVFTHASSYERLCILGERPGSGDGEREALMTRQMPYEPLPASVLFGLGLFVVDHGFKGSRSSIESSD